jgi:uncharacterized protein YgbK (DUF1537 family)
MTTPPLITWYGDDLTGAAAVAEVLTFGGVPSVLFLETPTPDRLAAFASVRGFGIAGTARAQSPDWMDTNLPAIYRFLATLPGGSAPLTHYKVCSTLDSSSTLGSIGRAIDLARPIFPGDWVPVVVAAPAIRRYQFYGNLFAAGPGGTYRLDRHPVMSRHPSTPMHEADVAAHLQAQTATPTGTLTLNALTSPETARAARDAIVNAGTRIVAIDAIDDRTLAEVGRLIWEGRARNPFVVGSQGVEYALVTHWRAIGLIGDALHPPVVTDGGQGVGAGRAPVVVVSGSASSVTSDQIAWAEANGFGAIPFEAAAVVEGLDSPRARDAIDRASEWAIVLTRAGLHPIIHTARGSDDLAITTGVEAMARAGVDASTGNGRIGAALGTVLDRTLRATGVRRAIISGGDTSGAATRALGIHALEALAPTIPGAALCRAHADDSAYAGLQIALKGGQMGSPDYFGWIRDGGGDARGEANPRLPRLNG